MKNRILTVLMAALVTLSAISACKRGDSKVIRFRYWGDTDELRIIEGLLHDFETAHPGVKVRGERKSSDIYTDVLLQECVSKTAPDVIFVSTDTFDTISASGILADLNPYLAKDAELKAKDYYPMLVKRFSSGPELQALPCGIAPISLVYYNKALFDAAKRPYPSKNWTWDELRQDAVAMTHRDSKGTSQFGYADDWNMDESFVLEAGGGIVDDYYKPSRLTCASPAAQAGMLFRYRLMQVDHAMPSSADSQSLNNGNLGLFLNGKLAMFQSGVWHIPAFRQIKSFKWDVAGFPLKKGGRYISGGAGYAMNKNTADPDLTWQLIRFIAGKEGESRMAATGLGQPALRALAESKVFLDGQDPQNKKILLAASDNCVPNAIWPSWREFHSSLWVPETDPIWLAGYEGGEAGVVKILKNLEAESNAKYFSQEKK